MIAGAGDDDDVGGALIGAVLGTCGDVLVARRVVERIEEQLIAGEALGAARAEFTHALLRLTAVVRELDRFTAASLRDDDARPLSVVH